MTIPIKSFGIHGNADAFKTKIWQGKDKFAIKKEGLGSIGQLNSSKNNKDVEDSAHLKEAARDFEKIFVTYMIKDMWKSIPKDEDSEMPGSNIYLEMIQSALANEMVKGKGLGIADMLYNQFKNRNETGQ